jgi:CelD/BcsL family acetyltransferase involved in cellulose biosynthesis
MKFQVIRTTAGFERLASEWNDLLAESAIHVPFLRHEYLLAWWSTLGGGEWPSAELFIVAARREADQRLVGLAPLFFANNRQAEPALLLLGSIEISDYLDLICLPPEREAFLGGLLDLLDGPQAPAWTALDWCNFPQDSPTLPALQAAADRRGWSYAQQRLEPAPSIPLPGDWETYLAGIDKKQRHEIRRKMRRAESGEQAVRWYIAQDPASLDAEIEAFMELMAFDEEKQRFLTPAMRTQMRAALRAAFGAGWLQLAFLEVDGQKAAAYLNFDYANHIWVYNSGINFAYGQLSPGWVLLGYLLQWAIEHGRAGFDFMRGDEEYKYRFGAQNRYVQRALIRRAP